MSLPFIVGVAKVSYTVCVTEHDFCNAVTHDQQHLSLLNMSSLDMSTSQLQKLLKQYLCCILYKPAGIVSWHDC